MFWLYGTIFGLSCVSVREWRDGSADGSAYEETSRPSGPLVGAACAGTSVGLGRWLRIGRGRIGVGTTRMLGTRKSLIEAIREALSTVTPRDALGWFIHCGYQARGSMVMNTAGRPILRFRVSLGSEAASRVGR